MNRARVFRFLRIGWSVGCGIIVILLIVLRSRSIDHRDEARVFFAGNRRVIIESLYLQLDLIASQQQMPWPLGRTGVSSESVRDVIPPTLFLDDDKTTRLYYGGFGIQFSPWQFVVIAIPHWFAIVSAGILAAIPWIRWRFSLRTLLIAMTLVAVTIGAIVAMSR
jgi:hypothetical protein